MLRRHLSSGAGALLWHKGRASSDSDSLRTVQVTRAPRLAGEAAHTAMHRGSRLSAQYAPQQRPASHPHGQQTAAGPASQQQQQGTAGAAGGGTAGGRVLEGGVPPLLIAKGYDVLGVIGEVSRWGFTTCRLPSHSCRRCACCRRRPSPLRLWPIRPALSPLLPK